LVCLFAEQVIGEPPFMPMQCHSQPVEVDWTDGVTLVTEHRSFDGAESNFVPAIEPHFPATGKTSRDAVHDAELPLFTPRQAQADDEPPPGNSGFEGNAVPAEQNAPSYAVADSG
jgi:hypothetical protein